MASGVFFPTFPEGILKRVKCVITIPKQMRENNHNEKMRRLYVNLKEIMLI
jgi:hypothetical protein